jgi:hypothetical protein
MRIICNITILIIAANVFFNSCKSIAKKQKQVFVHDIRLYSKEHCEFYKDMGEDCTIFDSSHDVYYRVYFNTKFDSAFFLTVNDSVARLKTMENDFFGLMKHEYTGDRDLYSYKQLNFSEQERIEILDILNKIQKTYIPKEKKQKLWSGYTMSFESSIGNKYTLIDINELTDEETENFIELFLKVKANRFIRFIETKK